MSELSGKNLSEYFCLPNSFNLRKNSIGCYTRFHFTTITVSSLHEWSYCGCFDDMSPYIVMVCVGVSWLQPLSLSSNTQLITRAHDTVWCNSNVVNFPKNSHKRHPIAHLVGRAMEWLLWARFTGLYTLTCRVLCVFHIIPHFLTNIIWIYLLRVQLAHVFSIKLSYLMMAWQCQKPGHHEVWYEALYARSKYVGHG